MFKYKKFGGRREKNINILKKFFFVNYHKNMDMFMRSDRVVWVKG